MKAKENGKAQLSFVAKESLGAVTSGGKEAIEIGNMLQEAAKEADLTPVVTGHSHGGGLAQCAAAGNGIKGVVFNSRPMGGAMRKHIGQNKVAENAKQVTAFSGKGDWLSRTRPLNMLAVAFERATGVTVPRTIGKGYNLPKGDVSYSQHNAFQAQLEELLFD